MRAGDLPATGHKRSCCAESTDKAGGSRHHARPRQRRAFRWRAPSLCQARSGCHAEVTTGLPDHTNTLGKDATLLLRADRPFFYPLRARRRFQKNKAGGVGGGGGEEGQLKRWVCESERRFSGNEREIGQGQRQWGKEKDHKNKNKISSPLFCARRIRQVFGWSRDSHAEISGRETCPIPPNLIRPSQELSLSNARPRGHAADPLGDHGRTGLLFFAFAR